jgi:hypothetical protein
MQTKDWVLQILTKNQQQQEQIKMSAQKNSRTWSE